LFPVSEATLPSTFAPILGALRGKETSGPQDHIAKIAGSTPYSDIRDIADVYLWCAEHPLEADGQRYLVVAGHGPRQAIYDILRKHYPERADIIPRGNPEFQYNKDWTFDLDGVRFDSSKVKSHTGLKFRSYEETVVDTAEFLAPFWRQPLESTG
jgi:nucleoside-diphosphate-sugar epimerase